MQPGSGPDMEPSTCPESISEPPRIHIWQSHVGLPKLAISRRYYKIFFPNIFRNSQPPIAPLEFRPGAKSYFRWSSTYQLFQRKFGLETVFFLIFRFQDTEKVSGKNNQKNLFSILSLLGVILQRLCSRQVPHVGSIQVAYILGFPTFVRRRRKNSPNLSSPSPNVRRDKISRSGKPLTLIYEHFLTTILKLEA